MDRTNRTLATDLRTLVVEQLEALTDGPFRNWNLPRMLAGHPVGADVRADLAFTLSHLAEGGCTEVGGHEVERAVADVLAPIDGSQTHTFFSYRVAEALGRHGRLATNPLVQGWAPAQVDEVARACDSTDWIPLLGEPFLPVNYAAVLARCELGRRRLGLAVDDEVLDDLLARTARLFSTNPRGFLDDDPAGGGRYDIYAVDLALFCEPFAEQIPDWEPTLSKVMDLVQQVVATDGTAVAWGRSTGLLGLCHTIELAALAIAGDPPRRLDPERWVGLAARAVDHLGGWFHRGLTTAHQHRSPYRYRGPARRAQLTLDALGKLAWAANRLEEGPEVAAAGPAVIFAPLDSWTRFEDHRPLGVWSYRSGHLSFVLPVTGTPWSDYLPAPRQPGCFETPVDRPLAVSTPTVLAGGRPHAAGGVPAAVRHATGALTLSYDGFCELGGIEGEVSSLAGQRTATVRVDRRTLHIEEHLHFDDVPDAVVVQVAEAADQPLVVESGGDHPGRLSTLETAGISEWRSFWGELRRVHQLDLDPAEELRFTWSVTPTLRVATDSSHHWYLRSLYDPMAPWVVDRDLHRPAFEHPKALDRLRAVDVYHLHWPEWVFDTDVEAARRFLELLERSDTALVWTQHNLLPHREGDFAALYATIAAGAHGVIHHSQWGREQALATHPYRPDAQHRVIPHGHWGHLATERSATLRAEAEAELDLAPCALRLGIVGAPRPGKRTVEFIEAFCATDRQDLGLLVTSLAPGDEERLPTDPRLRALPYAFVDRETYDRRLAAVDVLVFPFDADTRMLTTGVFADAVAHGLGAMVTGWGFLAEIMGDAGLALGDTPGAWSEALRELDADAVARAAAATEELRERYDWEVLATRTRTFLEDVAASRS